MFAGIFRILMLWITRTFDVSHFVAHLIVMTPLMIVYAYFTITGMVYVGGIIFGIIIIFCFATYGQRYWQKPSLGGGIYEEEREELKVSHSVNFDDWISEFEVEASKIDKSKADFIPFLEKEVFKKPFLEGVPPKVYASIFCETFDPLKTRGR